MRREKNVFISHYSKDDHHVQGLKKRLLAKNFKIKNSSIDSVKQNRKKRPMVRRTNKFLSPVRIKHILSLGIRWAGTFICLIGKETHTRPWVNFEIKEAHKQNKKIIGVFVHGAKVGTPLPANFLKYGNVSFGWNSADKIIDAIENNTPYKWENPDSTVSSPAYTLQTVTC